MSDYSKDVRAKHSEFVRQALAVKPRASLQELVSLIEKVADVHLSINYVLKLKAKLYEERKHRFDKAKGKQRLAEMQDKYEALESKMWELLLNPKVSTKERIRAAEVIAKLDKDFLAAQMDMGIFDNEILKIEEPVVDMDKYSPILQAFSNFGLIKKADVIEIKKDVSKKK